MDIDKFVHFLALLLHSISFGSLMDIDKFVQQDMICRKWICFGSLMDIDKFVRTDNSGFSLIGFGSLMDKIKQDLYYTLKAAILGGLFHAFITTNCEK